MQMPESIPEPINVSRKTIESLPLWYQALAEVLKDKGRLVFLDDELKG
jgi:hypothetical protein